MVLSSVPLISVKDMTLHSIVAEDNAIPFVPWSKSGNVIASHSYASLLGISGFLFKSIVTTIIIIGNDELLLHMNYRIQL